MIAEKFVTPYIPMLEIVKVPPLSSSGFNLFSLARPAMSFTSVAICSRPFKLMLRSTGAISPCGVYTAKLMFTFLNRRTKSPYQDEFVSGTLSAARAASFITKSLTEILEDEAALSFALSASSLSTLTDTVT
jgi:hypothetical protein